MKTLILFAMFQSDIAALDANEFAVREAAEARLSYWSDFTWPLLDRSFTSCEQQRRARRIVASGRPSSYAPLSFLSGRPMQEWALPDSRYGVIGACPGPEWHLAWLRPDPQATLALLIHCYGERVRNQYVWRDWMTTDDDRDATKMLCHDLLSLGVPARGVRRLADWLQAREDYLTTTQAMARAHP